jgi:hypothetical protein
MWIHLWMLKNRLDKAGDEGKMLAKEVFECLYSHNTQAVRLLNVGEFFRFLCSDLKL